MPDDPTPHGDPLSLRDGAEMGSHESVQLGFEGEQRRKVDWKDGSVLSPKEREYHQHFNTGPTPARYLALRLGQLDTRYRQLAARREEEDAAFYSGIPYAMEDPAVYDQYVEECRKQGAAVVMPRPAYSGT